MNYTTKNKTLRKNDLKDVEVHVLADGYNGLYNFAAITPFGHILTDAYDGYGIAISSTTYTGKRGLDVYVLNQGTFSLTNDTNYGTVGANTLRSAAQIGNSTGAADFNVGTTTGQTLRVSSNLSDGYGTKLSSTIVSGKDGLDVYLLNPAVAVTQSTSPWVVSGTVAVSNFPATVDTNYGTVGSNTLRSAAQIGNATGAADFNFGTVGAQTLRTASQLADGYGNLITSSANSAATKRPLDVWPTKGVTQHFNGTVGTSAATITPSSTTTAIIVYNPASNANGVTLSVSFDSGVTFFDIERRGTLSIETEVTSFQIKASAASTNYQILVTRR